MEYLMRHVTSAVLHLAIAAIALSDGCAIVHAVPPGLAQEPGRDPFGSTQLKPVRGTLLRIEGQDWLVKDREGHERSIRVDRDTRKSGSRPRIGEEIEVYVDSDAHARSIRTIAEK